MIGENDPSPRLAALAEAVGMEIAAAGVVLVCGGLGGAMEPACRGARSRGGVTIGILPGTRHADANPYVSYPIPTGLGHARNLLVARGAHAVIAVGLVSLSSIPLWKELALMSAFLPGMLTGGYIRARSMAPVAH